MITKTQLKTINQKYNKCDWFHWSLYGIPHIICVQLNAILKYSRHPTQLCEWKSNKIPFEPTSVVILPSTIILLGYQQTNFRRCHNNKTKQRLRVTLTTQACWVQTMAFSGTSASRGGRSTTCSVLDSRWSPLLPVNRNCRSGKSWSTLAKLAALTFVSILQQKQNF